MLERVNETSNKPAVATTKLWINTPKCTQSKLSMTKVCCGEFVCSQNNFRSQITTEFSSFVAVVSINRDRKLPNYLLPVATKPQIKGGWVGGWLWVHCGVLNQSLLVVTVEWYWVHWLSLAFAYAAKQKVVQTLYCIKWAENGPCQGKGLEKSKMRPYV